MKSSEESLRYMVILAQKLASQRLVHAPVKPNLWLK